MTPCLRAGLVGFGKIARDAHLPAIDQTDGIELVAVASPNANAGGVPNYPDLASMLAAEKLDAVILCQPPQARFEAAALALEAGKHVFLEKPPGSTVCEVEALTDLAARNKVTLFASWHSRFASAVAPAKEWIASRTLESVAITWKEDVRHWHPGQAWIWEPGGFGVFDPGINALSILTHVVKDRVRLLSAEIETPTNREAPIAARLQMAAGKARIAAEFDWRQTGPQTWDILFKADDGELVLGAGGTRLSIDRVSQEIGFKTEYASMYRHFVDLVHTGRSDVDLSPLKLVADALLCGRNYATDPFEE